MFSYRIALSTKLVASFCALFDYRRPINLFVFIILRVTIETFLSLHIEDKLLILITNCEHEDPKHFPMGIFFEGQFRVTVAEKITEKEDEK